MPEKQGLHRTVRGVLWCARPSGQTQTAISMQPFGRRRTLRLPTSQAMPSDPSTCRGKPHVLHVHAALLSIMMAQLMGTGSAVIVSGDNNDRHTIPNDIAAKHSVVFAAHGLGELDEVRVKDVRREDLNLLVKFVEEVSAVR